MKIEMDIVCQSCGGTGLYIGMAERDGAAVVCHACEGSGCYKYRMEYEPFNERQLPREKVERVFQANVGIGIGKYGENRTFSLEEFGGMPYTDWAEGKPFPPGSEMRQFTCPAWWYQSVDHNKKPEWNECTIGGAFSSCKLFNEKGMCWKRWDRQYGNTQQEKTDK